MATEYTDLITTTLLTEAERDAYSAELETTAAPHLIYDQFCEPKYEFANQRAKKVYWTIYRQLPPSIKAIPESTDIDGTMISSFTRNADVAEHGFVIGTTELLERTSWHGPILSLIGTMLAPQMALTQDIMARNAFFGSGATYRGFGGTATSRATLYADATFTEGIIRQAANNLARRRVPLLGNGYVCITHSAVTYDLKNTSYWKDADLYSGSVKIYNGEVGMMHGVRFIETDNARLPNAGTVGAVETTLSSAAAVGDDHIHVADTTGISANDEITLYQSTSSLPDGTDEEEEHVIVDEVASSTLLNLKTELQIAHASSDKVRSSLDVFPAVFLGGGDKAVGKGIILEPEVRVAPVTDKLGRMRYVGWYGIFGYDVIREWNCEVWEVASSTESAPAFPW
jgi:N4-gp56 family major capsid protein